MRIRAATFVFWSLLSISPAIADMQCGQRPEVVKSYLQSHPNWSVVTLDDLQSDDQKLWKENRNGLCPGLATVQLDQTNSPSYAVALLRHDSSGTQEKLILLSGADKKNGERTLVDAVSISNPSVVYRVGPGRSYDAEKRKYIRLKYDSIVFEKLESTSTSFYFVGGKLLTLVGSY